MVLRPLIGIAILLAWTPALYAHAQLDTSTPANDAVVQGFDEITLRFDAPTRVTFMTLTGPNGAVEITRETGLDPVTAFRATPPADLQRGAYAIDWRGLSPDGHIITGHIDFTVAD